MRCFGTPATPKPPSGLLDHAAVLADTCTWHGCVRRTRETGADMRVYRIDHVQLAMPPGGEDLAVAFYDRLLGLPRAPKPPHMESRGGCWFTNSDVALHLGVEADFRPARKAHPALLVDDLPALVETLRSGGFEVSGDQPLDGFDRCYVDDPFGNRIELMQQL